MVEVQVGRSTPVPMLLDTGSTGIADIRRRGRHRAGQPGDGDRSPADHLRRRSASNGRRRHRAIAFSGGRSMRPVALFGFVQEATCVPGENRTARLPADRRARWHAASTASSVSHEEGPSGLASPILGMRTRLARSWSIRPTVPRAHRARRNRLRRREPASPSELAPLGAVGTNRRLKRHAAPVHRGRDRKRCSCAPLLVRLRHLHHADLPDVSAR